MLVASAALRVCSSVGDGETLVARSFRSAGVVQTGPTVSTDRTPSSLRPPWTATWSHRYHLRSAESGFAPAEYTVAQHYLGATDRPRAFDYLRRAARHGHAPAQVEMGFLYRNGSDAIAQDLARPSRNTSCTAATRRFAASPGDLPTTAAWLKRSVEGGNPSAQAALGRAHQDGRSVPRDPALAWLRKSRGGVAPHDDHLHDDEAPLPETIRDGHRHQH